MGCLPPHNLKLKIGTPIVIIRNIPHPVMVNGTRAEVSALHRNVIEATKLDGSTILIPRITIIPSDSNNSISFKRKQFPVKPCYAMTINRSQKQVFYIKNPSLHLSLLHPLLFIPTSYHWLLTQQWKYVSSLSYHFHLICISGFRKSWFTSHQPLLHSWAAVRCVIPDPTTEWHHCFTWWRFQLHA
jgi:hypothetical protein